MSGDAGGTVTWRSLWLQAAEQLGDANQARWVCEEASGLRGIEWVEGLERPVTDRAVARLDAMLARCAAGEPLQYVLGSWSFRRLDLLVDRRVLIPRPETEQVVEVALEAAAELAQVGEGSLTVVDLGTGSGAIALSLAAELPLGRATVWATDSSTDALDVARANLAGIGRGAAHVRVAEGTWWEALPGDLEGGIDLVVSNPPYIADSEELDASVTGWEPVGALRSGADGLDATRVIVAGATSWLRPGGVLVVEIGAGRGEAAAALARRAGLVGVEVRRDLAGRDRMLVARRPV